MHVKRTAHWILAPLLLACACAPEADEAVDESLGTQAFELNACDETVPANRFIDGIPAYAQCAMFEAGPIYSNNGVDTSATKMGSDWVETQRSGGYQCTELAHRYWLFRWKVSWLPRGNAGSWCDTQPTAASGVVQSTTPSHGDLMVLAPGSCGADPSTGHVTVVDVVDTASQKLTVVEQNRARRGTYMQSCAKCFLHVIANDGGAAAPLPPGDAGAKPLLDAGPLPDAGGTRDAAVNPSADAGVADTGAARPIGPDAAIVAPTLDAGTLVDAALQVVPGLEAGTGSDAAAPVGPQGEAEDDEEGGCSVQPHGARASGVHVGLLGVMLGLALTGRRRRRR
jgi:MYXO-CTERM domain-containing protein